MNYIYHIKSPKNPNDSTKNLLLDHLNELESAMTSFRRNSLEEIDKWISIEEFLPYYWVQEFSKNEDGNFARSVFFTWVKDTPIHFGPLWDFDLAFGNASREKNKTASDWYIRKYRLYYYVFSNTFIQSKAKDFWIQKHDTFKALIDSIPIYKKQIEKAVQNEYKRWPVISNTENWALKDPYDSYDDAVQAMVIWLNERYNWINNNL